MTELECFPWQGEDDYMNSLGLYDGYDSYNDSGGTTDDEENFDANLIPPNYSQTKAAAVQKKNFRYLNGKEGMGRWQWLKYIYVFYACLRKNVCCEPSKWHFILIYPSGAFFYCNLFASLPLPSVCHSCPCLSLLLATCLCLSVSVFRSSSFIGMGKTRGKMSDGVEVVWAFPFT